MKNSATLLALLAATLCTFSCMKETDFGTGSAPEGYYEEIITTVIPGGGTRTSFDNTTGVFSWSEGDQIAFHLSNGEYITAPINAETGKVRLYIPEGVTRDEFAVYPASTVVTDHAEKGDMQLALPDSYDISGALQSEYCPTTMLAVQDPESSTLRFNHAGGLVQLNLEVPAQTKIVKVEFPDRVVTGTIPVSADNTYYKLDLDDPEHNEEGGSEIDVTVSEDGLEEATSVRINVPVPSGTYNKVKITYNNGATDTWEYTKNSSFTLNRSGGKRLSPNQQEFTDAMDYFHIIGLANGSSVKLKCPLSEMYYSIDGRQTFNRYTSETTIPLDEGDIVWFYNTNGILSQRYYYQNAYNYNNRAQFSGTGSLEAAGLLVTLTNKNFDVTATPENLYPDMNYAYAMLFSNMTALKKVEELNMGAEYNMGEFCFYQMFSGCKSITTSPELPSMVVYTGAYQSMFENCTSLVAAPELPATTVYSLGYKTMFSKCTSLLTAPELPATTIGDRCYQSMFEQCTKLTTITSTLPATTIYYSAYEKMFLNCSSIVTPPEIYATSIPEKGCLSMFQNCTSLTKTPQLPATTVGNNGYASMFYGCTSLTSITTLFPATALGTNAYGNMFRDCTSLVHGPSILPTLSLGSGCYGSMFRNCTALIDAPELPATTLANDCYKGMFYGCISLTSIPNTELPCQSLTESCYEDMFFGCSSLTTAPNLPATTLANNCYRSMFYGCTALTDAPELPATTLCYRCYEYMFTYCRTLTKAPELPAPILQEECYELMFDGCTSLNEITCLATDISATNSLLNWTRNVSSTGTFYRNITATDWTTGSNGIPSGWTVYTVEDITPQI